MRTQLDGYLAIPEAAQRLGVTDQRVRQLLKADRLDHLVTPIGRLVVATDVERLAAKRAARSATRQGQTEEAR